MHATNPVLDPVNVQAALGELDLLPLQVADLRGPQTVAIGDQDHGRIPMPVAAILTGAVHQPLDLALGEIASFDCQAYDAWSRKFGQKRFLAMRRSWRGNRVACFGLPPCWKKIFDGVIAIISSRPGGWMQQSAVPRCAILSVGSTERTGR